MMAQPKDPYYRELEHSEIRLLKIVAGEQQNSLITELTSVSLDHDPEYEALSYTWGFREPPHYLTCDGQPVRVTGNLHKALCRLRKPDAARYVWVDAICVNQSDKVEKAKQIPKMLQIYSKASVRLIWLGSPSSPRVASLAFETMRILESIFATVVDPGRLAFRHPQPLDVESRKRYSNQVLEKLESQNIAEEQWQALAEFFSVDWFTRVWVVQEAASECQRHYTRTRTTIFWGEREANWESLITVASGLTEFGLGSKIRPYMAGREIPTEMLRTIGKQRTIGVALPPLIHPEDIDRDPDFSIGGTQSRLFDFLRLSRYLSSSEPRDKIFAFLGLMDVEVQSEPLLEPNYERNVIDVYINATLFFLTRERCLDIFELICDQPPTADKVDGLPSWAIDWTQKPRTDPIRVEWSRFAAGGLSLYGFSTSAVTDLYVSPDRRNLLINAHIVGKIVNHVPPSAEYTEEYLRSKFTDGSLNENSLMHTVLKLWEKADFFLSSLIQEWIRYRDCLRRAHMLDPGFTPASFHWEPPSRAAKYKSTGESLFEAFWRTLVCDIDGMGNKASPELGKAFEVYHEWINLLQDHREALNEDLVNRFSIEYGRHTKERRFCVTSNSMMGWAPRRAAVGDVVCVFPGARFPYIVRFAKQKGCAELLGYAYIHGLMEAETEKKHPNFGQPKALAQLGEKVTICLI